MDHETAAQLIEDAAHERTIRHGKHAADLLDEHGHPDEAALIRAEVRAQNGHLSARQAADFLRRPVAPTTRDDPNPRR
ncbi:hypothetical protein ABZ605_28270 [Streptomyces sp. NPDC012765]|uniref:hypothetical protein n=1 Tax=Streptomyces sp. NPDC012765 TaxID=3155249 RepID=UPI0033EE8397